MKWLKRVFGLVIILFIVIIITVVIIINPFGASFLNKYTKNGDLTLSGLKAQVTVNRDEKGMAYIYAQNMEDLWLSQGFIAAQDRLFQMELTKLFASGRISELAGEKARNIDIRMRTLGFYRNAKKHTKLLNDKTQTFLHKYVDGVNEFIRTRVGLKRGGGNWSKARNFHIEVPCTNSPNRPQQKCHLLKWPWHRLHLIARQMDQLL